MLLTPLVHPQPHCFILSPGCRYLLQHSKESLNITCHVLYRSLNSLMDGAQPVWWGGFQIEFPCAWQSDGSWNLQATHPGWCTPETHLCPLTEAGLLRVWQSSSVRGVFQGWRGLCVAIWSQRVPTESLLQAHNDFLCLCAFHTPAPWLPVPSALPRIPRRMQVRVLVPSRCDLCSLFFLSTASPCHLILGLSGARLSKLGAGWLGAESCLSPLCLIAS